MNSISVKIEYKFNEFSRSFTNSGKKIEMDKKICYN